MIKRASDAEQKSLKRQMILDAALGLFEESEGRLATVESIAKEASMAKGTIYLYFKTREEIYMSLLEGFLEEWLDLIGTVDRKKAPSVEGLVNYMCVFIERKASFMKLASIFNGILEKNIDFDTAYACKVNLRERVFAASRYLSNTYPYIDADRAAIMILRSFAMSIGLWQVAEPAPVLKEVLNQEELSLLKIDFMTELKASLTILWRGVFDN